MTKKWDVVAIVFVVLWLVCVWSGSTGWGIYSLLLVPPLGIGVRRLWLARQLVKQQPHLPKKPKSSKPSEDGGHPGFGRMN